MDLRSYMILCAYSGVHVLVGLLMFGLSALAARTPVATSRRDAQECVTIGRWNLLIGVLLLVVFTLRYLYVL